MGRFEGFSSHTVEFFIALGMNNSKAFFENHRQEYERYLLQPLRDLAFDIAPHMLAIDAQLDARPVIGGAISRIYKDARRVRGGPPYKEYMYLKYCRRGEEHDLGFYFDISADYCTTGLGLFKNTPKYMNSLRRYILENSMRYKQILQSVPGYGLFGDTYKRPPLGSADAQVQDILKRRYFFFQKEIPLENTFTADFAEKLQHEFARLQPLYDFFRHNELTIN